MNENKECKIFGYGTYTDKESKEPKMRVVIGVYRNDDKFIGYQVTAAFLDYDEELATEIVKYLSDKDSDKKAYYETTDNIFTGKTKISKIIIKEN